MKDNVFNRFTAGLQSIQKDMNEGLEELRAFSEVMARKDNTLEMDEDGFFYITACGPLEIIIPTVEKQLTKLKRIQKQKDEER